MCKIFVIEGPDYSGKTTLINRLCKYFKSNGKRVAIFKEPSGEIREMLLDKDGNLPFATRRCLFAADHFQTLDSIYKVRDNYDYIFMDRSTVISDLVYAPSEIDSDYAFFKMSELTREQFLLIDSIEYDSFFMCNTHLILLRLPKQELLNRMYSRAINSNDIFDIKSDDFKILIWQKYNELIDSLMNHSSSNIQKIFNSISSIEVDDNILENTRRLIEGDK